LSAVRPPADGRGPVDLPGGMPPPTSAMLPDQTPVDLNPLAVSVAERHLRRHPEDTERYGELARAWCVHDAQHLMAWGIADLDFAGQLRWLAGVLDARGYPVANLFDCVLTCASVLRDEFGPGADTAARRMEDAARELAAGG
jgi:hypothetical protein